MTTTADSASFRYGDPVRERLTVLLAEYLGAAVRVQGDEAGLHLVAWFPGWTPTDVDAIVAACRALDVGLYSISRHALTPLPIGGLMLGYALLGEAAIEEGVKRLAAAVDGVRGRRDVPRPGLREGLQR